MTATMQLGRITIFPIKSLKGVDVTQARITTGGILENDRVYSIRDAEGKVVNGKRTPRVHQLQAEFDDKITEVRLWQSGESSSSQFPLADRPPINRWLSDFFALPVTLEHQSEKGYPDDLTAFGPTILSEASLQTVQGWFPELTLESVRRRFRANLELVGGPAFCEDRLYGVPGELKPFEIGQVRFLGHNPCQRCVVPTRDPDGGRAIHEFQKKFAQLRREHLPEWANAQRFNHFYRFAVNTSVQPPEAGKCLQIGDAVRL